MKLSNELLISCSIACLALHYVTGCSRDFDNVFDEQTDSSTPQREEGLVAFYPFNGNANDESGNGNNGTVSGAILAEDRFGNANNAYSFDGANLINTGIMLPNIFSLSLWYNAATNQKENAGLVSTYSFNRFYGFYYSLSGNASAGWIRYDNNGLNATESAANRWVNLVIISDGSNIEVYLDSELKLKFTGATSHSDKLILGDSRFNGRYFTGRIDDVRIYDHALTNEEIQTLYRENGWAN